MKEMMEREMAVRLHEKSLPPNAEPDHSGNNLGIFVGTDWG